MPRRKSRKKNRKQPIQNEIVQVDSINSLSDELILYIFSYLFLLDISNIELTSKRFKNISKDKALWLGFINKYFPHAKNALFAAQNLLPTTTEFNRREDFKFLFDIVFDKRFFPDLQNNKQRLNALEGRLDAIIDSTESDDSKMALLAAAAANGNAAAEDELDPAARGFALVCADRNGNASLMEKLYKELKKPSNTISLDFINLIHKALIHRGNIPAISHVLQNCKLSSSYAERQMLMQALERYGSDHSITKEILTLTNNRRHSNNTSPVEFSTCLFFTKEAAYDNHCIEIFIIEAEEVIDVESNPEEIIIRLISNPKRHTITYDEEMAMLNDIGRHRFFAISTFAIRYGYVELMNKLLNLNHTLSVEDYSTLCINPRSVPHRIVINKLIIERMVEKAFVCALQRADKENLQRLCNTYAISSTIRGKGFLYAAKHSQLEILAILLGEDGSEIDEKFIRKAFKMGNPVVNNFLTEYGLSPGSKIGNLIQLLSNTLISNRHISSVQRTETSKSNTFFDKEVSQKVTFEDLNEPVTLVLAFNHFRKNRAFNMPNDSTFSVKSSTVHHIDYAP